MRVVLLNKAFYPRFGGIENSLYYIALNLKLMGHEPIVVAGQHDKSLPLHDEVQGIEVFRYVYPTSSWTYFFDPIIHVLAAKKQLKLILEQIQADVIWCRSAYLCFAAHQVGFKGPIVFIPPVLIGLFQQEISRNLSGNTIHKSIRWVRHLLRSYQVSYVESVAFQAATFIITFSKNMHSQVVRQYPFTKNRISVIKPGVDIVKFAPQTPRPDLMQSFGLSKEHKVFLYVGRLTAEKNVNFLIDAFSMINNTNDRLILVGNGYDRHILEKNCKELGLEKKVIFAGHQENTAPFYNLAHFFLLPTLYEGFGQVYLEALSSGVPCIGYAGEYTATDEIVKDGVNGFIVYEHSPKALSLAFRQAHKLNEEKYQSMCRRARNSILNDYRWEHFVARTIDITGG